MRSSRILRLIDEHPDMEKDLLGPEWDPAFLGIAYDSHTKRLLPAYGYQAMKSVLLDKKVPPVSVIPMMEQLLSCDNAVIVPRSRFDYLMQRVNKRRIPAWDMLDRAAIGVWRGKLCYIENICIDILKNSGSKLNDETDIQEEIRVRNQFERNIRNADLGENSPVFIELIK